MIHQEKYLAKWWGSKAQHTVEYLLFLAFMFLVILFLVNKKNSPFEQGVKNYINGTREAVVEILK